MKKSFVCFILILVVIFGSFVDSFASTSTSSDLLVRPKMLMSAPLLTSSGNNDSSSNSVIYDSSRVITLPSIYQQVEYIESTGNGQYIDTNFFPDSNSSFSLKAIKYSTFGSIFGSYDSSSGLFYTFQFSNWDYSFYNIGSFTKISVPYSSSPFEYLFTNSYVKDLSSNSYLVSFTPSSFSVLNNSIKIFKSDHSSSLSSFSLFYFKIYQDNSLVRNFVPCYVKSTGVIGLYDTVNGVFYTNQGTGTFLKGSDILPIQSDPTGETTGSSITSSVALDFVNPIKTILNPIALGINGFIGTVSNAFNSLLSIPGVFASLWAVVPTSVTNIYLALFIVIVFVGILKFLLSK